jgi:hypothetical protein
MNVLEKILEEIEKAENEYCHEEHSPMFCMGACSMAADVKEIIRAHMDEVPDSVGEKSILCTVDKDGVLTPYDDTYDVVIHCSTKENQEQTVKLIKDSNWIPVSERLPKVPEGTEDEYCPEFNVTIKGADKATTLKFAPDGTWFDDSGEVYSVIAWKPLTEPYKEGEHD